jgi:formylglycine-generating enzyme required for sulfatase activity
MSHSFPDLDNKANTSENRYGKTRPVGSYEDGRSWIGAYDLAGNVYEWVADWYGDNYYQQQVTNDPAGPVSGEERVMRGGPWFDSHNLAARTAVRHSNRPGTLGAYFGFRLIVEERPSSQ